MVSPEAAAQPRPPCDTAQKAAKLDPPMVNLTTPMIIAPNTKFFVQYRSDMKLNMPGGRCILFSASNPAEFTAPSTMLLSPTEELGTGFERGWSDTPEEIRIDIMGYVMASSDHIIRSGYTSPPDFATGTSLCEYVCMGGDFARLAQEAYYKYNTTSTRVGGMNHALELPPPSVSHHIRSIVLRTDYTCEAWQLLARVGQGGFGLTNIKHTTVELDPWTLGVHFLENLPKKTTFECEGQLIMPGLHFKRNRRALLQANRTQEESSSWTQSAVKFSD